MKKLIIITVLMAVTISVRAEYRNVFVELGYHHAQVEARLNRVFNEVFHGPNKVYFEVGDSMGYISDIKNHDARTEGMSYGMMIAVQFGEKDIFDRLWRWSKKYMQHQSGNREGYFAWSCKTDGTHNAEGAASDGELYFITSLIFASNRWGNDTGINYKAEAQRILNCIQPKEYTPEIRQGGFGGFGGWGQPDNRKDITNKFNNAKNWAEGRPNNFYKFIGDQWKLGSPVALTVNKNAQDVALNINGIDVLNKTFDGKFFANRQLTITCTAPEGQEVKGWKLSGAKTEEVNGSELTINMTAKALNIEPVLGISSGIKTIENTILATKDIYDLMGNKVTTPQAGRIYIQNGKKIIWR